MQAMILNGYGDADAFEFKHDVPDPKPNNSEILIKLHYAGLNFIDVYFRNGLYPLPAFPAILGKEGAGEVVAIGKNATGFKIGDFVVFPFASEGSYCEYATVEGSKAVVVPAGIDRKQAAASVLQGLTAHYLSFSTFSVKREHTVLIHAGAGGVGLLLTQMVKNIGARVITTVSNEMKKELSKQNGADEVIIYDQYKFSEKVLELTEGQGVDVVYDSVAKETFEQSLQVIKPRGLLALFGNSSGAVPPFDLNRLNPAGALYVTRPSLGHYINAPGELNKRMTDIFTAMQSGNLNVRIGQIYPLKEISQAHKDLERRKTTGKSLIQIH